jgi:hypothetical protein
MAKKPVKPVVKATTEKVHPDSKLTQNDVTALRADHASGVTFAELAVKYKMALPMARDIALGRLFA